MRHLSVRANAHNRDDTSDYFTVHVIRELNHWTVDTDDHGSHHEFMARLIGFASSEKQQHNHGGSGTDGSYSRDARSITDRCGACRWQETRIFLLDEKDHAYHGGKFAVHTLGVSILDGERVRVRLSFVNTGFEVVELLTVRKGEHAAPYIPGASARALAMAAASDRDLKDAYVNRAVA